MPEVHKVITLYHQERMKLDEYNSDAIIICKKIDDIIGKNDEIKFNLMLSPSEFNNKIDDVVKNIRILYEKIMEIQKLKIEK